MRKIKDRNFNYRLAKAINNNHKINTPDEEAEKALRYIKQFVVKTSSNSELIRGYIPDSYINALVRIRDESPKAKDLGSFIESIGADGRSSQKVDRKDSEFEEFTIDRSNWSILDLEDKLYQCKKETNNEEVKDCIKGIRAVIDNTHPDVYNHVNYYMPQEAHEELEDLLK